MSGDCRPSGWTHCSKSGLVTPGLREKELLTAGGGDNEPERPPPALREKDPLTARGGENEPDPPPPAMNGGPEDAAVAGLLGEAAAEPKAERNAAVLAAIWDARLPADCGEGDRQRAAASWRAGEDEGRARDGDDAIRGQLRGLAGPPAAAAHTLVECDGELAAAGVAVAPEPPPSVVPEPLLGGRGGERIRSTACRTPETAALVEVDALRPMAPDGSVGRGTGLGERDLTGKHCLYSVSGPWSVSDWSRQKEHPVRRVNRTMRPRPSLVQCMQWEFSCKGKSVAKVPN